MLYKKTYKLNRSESFKNFCDLKLLVIGGMHGNESNAVDIVSRLYVNLLKPENEYNKPWWHFTRFSEVTIVNAVNYSGLKYNQREFYQEEISKTDDLNRFYNTESFPTKEDIMSELEKEILRNDVIVDVHNTANLRTCISIALNDNAAAYVDWSIRNNVRFVLTGNSSTLKRHADVDFDKVAYTYEFCNMGYDVETSQISREHELIALEKFLAKTGDLTAFEKNFVKLHYKNGKELSKNDPSCFQKICNNYNLLGPGKLERYKMRSIVTHADGLYDFSQNGAPLHDYVKHDWDEDYDHIAAIVEPVTRLALDFIYPPCDGWLVDVDNSYWACKDGCFGDFQPFLPKAWVEDFYREEKERERQAEEDKIRDESK